MESAFALTVTFTVIAGVHEAARRPRMDDTALLLTAVASLWPDGSMTPADLAMSTVEMRRRGWRTEPAWREFPGFTASKRLDGHGHLQNRI
jgi:hypothetical protein